MRISILKKEKHERHIHSTFLSDFILGSQDGLVNVLGIILGVSAATTDIRLIFVAGLAALGAESISMGAVAYTSTAARRKQYIKEMEFMKQRIDKTLDHDKNEVRAILRKWGYKGRELSVITKHIVSNPKAALDFVVALGHKVAPVEKSAPFRSFMTVLAATIFGSMIPLVPYIFLTRNISLGATVSVIISGITLFCIGYYEAKKTIGSIWRNGLQLAIIGLTAGFAGYLIGHFIGALPLL